MSGCFFSETWCRGVKAQKGTHNTDPKQWSSLIQGVMVEEPSGWVWGRISSLPCRLKGLEQRRKLHQLSVGRSPSHKSKLSISNTILFNFMYALVYLKEPENTFKLRSMRATSHNFFTVEAIVPIALTQSAPMASSFLRRPPDSWRKRRQNLSQHRYRRKTARCEQDVRGPTCW